MKRTLPLTLALALLSNPAFATASPEPSGASGTSPASATSTATGAMPAPGSPASGLDGQHFDRGVRAQDDFFRHVNGTWLKKEEIPADKSSWGAFLKLRDDTQPHLRAIIEAAARDTQRAPGSDTQKIGDFYASFMDEARLESLGVAPLRPEMARIAAIKDRKDLALLIARFNRIGVKAPFDIGVHQDNKDSTKYVADIYQSGLGMPDRDYYLKTKEAAMAGTRAKYLAHIEKMLSLAGDKDARANARRILELETGLAKVQWSAVDNRDPVKAYNKIAVAKMDALTPGIGWRPYLEAAGVLGKVDYLIVSQPSYLSGYGKLLSKTPLPVWKSYFTFHLLNEYSAYLSKDFVDQGFAFKGVALTGVKENRPRWKRAVTAVDSALGESVGKIYVAQHFPPERKARMEALVNNLLLAFRQSVDTLDWMSAATKVEAKAKLDKFTVKVGYPDRWRDYSGLTVERGDLVGNVMRSKMHNYEYGIGKLGKPIQRHEWGMTPQTVNAYYNPEMNEIVFPAAILQPPFFDMAADDAVNYGGIGGVIGHEISHGFDDSGAQYDGDGNLRVWWTDSDRKNFAAKSKALVAQYSGYSPVPGHKVNGELTLGENIADNSGLAIALKAYRISLGGKPSPVIDGLTGEQRLFMGWAQVWRGKTRDAQSIAYLKTDPHSPDEFRANGTVRNITPFYEAFGVKEGDGMWLPPAARVSIW